MPPLLNNRKDIQMDLSRDIESEIRSPSNKNLFVDSLMKRIQHTEDFIEKTPLHTEDNRQQVNAIGNLWHGYHSLKIVASRIQPNLFMENEH